MAKCISYQNTEYLVLQHFTCELSTAIISADLTLVAPRLFAKRVITETQLQEAQLQSKTEKERATKLPSSTSYNIIISSEILSGEVCCFPKSIGRI